MRELSKQIDPRILVGAQGFDDAGVYLENENLAHVASMDFFNPIVDDPFSFGAIAAANALSDLYAMGAKPSFALNIVGFPRKKLPIEILEKIIEGGLAKTKEAGIPIIGGHSIELAEPTYGLMVHGTIHPQKIIRNKGMQEGDHLILTKPLGCGAITAGIRKGKVSREFEEEAIRVMQQLNKKASEIMIRHPVHAATDVTGFGLLGHLNEMVQASQATVKLALLRLDFLPGARELAQQNIVPMATQENLKDSYQITGFSEDISLAERLLLADAQTSGGLIMAISAEKKSALVEELSQAGIKPQEFAVVSHLGSPGIQVVRDF